MRKTRTPSRSFLAVLAIAIGTLMAIAGATLILGPYVLLGAGIALVLGGVLVDVDGAAKT